MGYIKNFYGLLFCLVIGLFSCSRSEGFEKMEKDLCERVCIEVDPFDIKNFYEKEDSKLVLEGGSEEFYFNSVLITCSDGKAGKFYKVEQVLKKGKKINENMVFFLRHNLTSIDENELVNQAKLH